MKVLVSALCFVVAIATLLFLPLRDAVAETDIATRDEGAVSERSMSQAEPADCSNPKPCCPHSTQAPPEDSHRRGIGERINGFLAFGCRLNYRLTDWALSDKCDAGRLHAFSPCKKVSTECAPACVSSVEKQ